MATHELLGTIDMSLLERRTSRSKLTALAGAGIIVAVLASLMPASPVMPASPEMAASLEMAASPVMVDECQFAAPTPETEQAGIEPQLLIDADCTDPAYNEDTFVITDVQDLNFTVPGGGPTIPYTQVTGNFPATNTPESLPPGVLQSPTLFQQDYVFRFPANEFWENRSMQVQHPTGGGQVDLRLAFTNGAFTVNWLSASIPNAVATHRVHAGATKVAKAYAKELYDDTDEIYSYIWGCSGGGVVAQAAAENVTGIWDGVQVQCTAPAAATHHAFHWQNHYALAVSPEKQAAVAAAAVPGGTGDIYAGLTEEEQSVLDELLGGGFPVESLGSCFACGSLTPLVSPAEFRVKDPTYEDDFWSLPGYAGSDPPSYLADAHVDGFATITGITRNAAGVPTAIQLDPATVPPLGSIGATNLNYYVFDADGTTRTIDPNPSANATDSNARFTLTGDLNTTTGVLTLTGTNSPVLLDALTEGGKIRVNNRFILSVYFHPRHQIIEGNKGYDQYRNPDGSPKYPQRAVDVVSDSNYRTMGGRIESGHLQTKTMIIANKGDNLSFPLFNASYYEQVQSAMGPAEAKKMVRFYYQENGGHSVRGLIAGTFNQSLIDLMAWAEEGIAPPPSTRYTIDNGQVVHEPQAGARKGLQPVIALTANGGDRAVVGVNQPVNLAGRIQMPPSTGRITQFHWTVGGADEAPTILERPSPGVVKVNRTFTFDTPGTYVVRLNVSGQREGLVAPFDETVTQNFRDVRVVVE